MAGGADLKTLSKILGLCLSLPIAAAPVYSAGDNSQVGVSDKSELHGAANQKSDTEALALSPDKINKLLESEDVYGEQFKVSSFVQGNDVTVQTWVNPKSKNPERDSKINAVLIGKKLMDAYPDVKLVKVRYFDRQERNKYTQITVVPGLVKSFAAGIMSEADMLMTLPTSLVTETAAPAASSAQSALSAHPASATGTAGGSSNLAAKSSTLPISAAASTAVSSGAQSALLQVQPGFEYEKRADILKRLQALEKIGVKSPSSREMLALIEDQIREGRDKEALPAINRLANSVTEMEKQFQKARASVASAVQNKSSGSNNVKTAHALLDNAATRATQEFETGIAIIKKKMGDFYPHYGPLYVDRVNIGNQIVRLKESGQNVDLYKPAFLQMEATVISGGYGLEQAVRRFNELLKLREAPRDDEYRFQQNLADQRKGKDLK
ncbi:MAG: hypothetical protein K2X27_05540 [Candidatus Obscuribacterales bacterium]|nr:hypothetical protein [Candidatus Obscuribacterales bacterium]